MPNLINELTEFELNLSKSVVHKDDQKEAPELAVHASEQQILDFMLQQWIMSRDGELVQFHPYPHQEKVLDWLFMKRREEKPAQGICCKGRQLGISSLIQLWMFTLLTLQSHRLALVAAHDVDAAKVVFARTRTFYYYTENPRPVSRLSSNGMTYQPPHFSQIDIDTSNNDKLGRSGTYQYVHVTEAAYWEHPEEPLLGLQNCIPKAVWDTLYFLESTAKAPGDFFHSKYEAAKSKILPTSMDAIFLEWKGFPYYSIPLMDGETLQLDEAEKEHVEKWKLTPGEAKWFQLTKSDACHGDMRLFRREYPMSDEEAFSAAHDCFFDAQALQWMREREVREPDYRGDIQWDETKKKSIVKLTKKDDMGFFLIWAYPLPGRRYLLVMDVSNGLEQDWTVINVLLLPEKAGEKWEQVAKWKSCTTNATDAGIKAWQIGLYYNTAMIAVERPGAGETSLGLLKNGQLGEDNSGSPFMRLGYPNLYRETSALTEIKNRVKKTFGFLVTRPSKTSALHLLQSHIHTMQYLLRSRDTITEMLGYQYDYEKGKFIQTYQNGRTNRKNDDEIATLRMASYILDRHGDRQFFAKAEINEV